MREVVVTGSCEDYVEDQFLVVSGSFEFTEFQDFKWPCVYACAAITRTEISFMDYVEHNYKKLSLEAVYAGIRHLVPIDDFLLMVFCLLLLVLQLVDHRKCVCATEANYSPKIYQFFVFSAMNVVTTKEHAKVDSLTNALKGIKQLIGHYCNVVECITAFLASSILSKTEVSVIITISKC
jgi:hypothetical protein